MTTKTPRVAKVIDEFVVAFNIGTADGVKIGSKYLVYGVGPELADPETGESLGSIELVRGTVTVFHVQEKQCQARCNQVTKKPTKRKLISNDLFRFGLGSRDEIVEDIIEIPTELVGATVGDFAKPY